ncbi:MAG: RdgB/HAM1 family non-canonical purine NTP pyrophosphatase [Pseudomonadota bacterium]
MKVVLASGNAGKLKELGTLLAPLGVELITQGELGIEGAEETGCTFVENALLKARHASRLAGLPAIADDSGLAVEALDGAPGVYSARYAGVAGADADAANNAKLIAALETSSDRRAHFHSVIVFLKHPEDPTPIIADGRWDGEIVTEPRGENGFGYDPHFFIAALGLTAAELDAERKNSLSHRGIAAASLLERLSAESGK